MAVQECLWRVEKVARIDGERVYVCIDGATMTARGEMGESACCAGRPSTLIRDMACYSRRLRKAKKGSRTDHLPTGRFRNHFIAGNHATEKLLGRFPKSNLAIDKVDITLISNRAIEDICLLYACRKACF